MERFMKKALLPLFVLSALAVYYELSQPEPNMLVMIPGILLFVFCLIWLNARIPPKKDNEDGEVQ